MICLFKRIFKKEKQVKDIPPIPEWNKIVERLYDKSLDSFSDEVVDIIYSKDKSMRYVITKDEKGLFRYCLESICQFDEDEWKYICEYSDIPAMWEVHPGLNGSSIFDTKEIAIKEIKVEPYYKQYFE